MQSTNSESVQFIVNEGISRSILSGAPEELRRVNLQGETPLFLACKHDRLEVAQWLFGAGAAEDVRTASRSGGTPMLWACSNGHLEVAQWLICNGAATNASTGYVDASVMETSGAVRMPRLRRAIETSISNNSNFTSLILPAICDLHGGLCGSSTSIENEHLRFLRPCHLSKLRGLESSVVAYIADFLGVVRGSQLRNLHGAHSCL